VVWAPCVDALGAIRDDTAFWGSLSDRDIGAWEPPDRLLTADDTRLDQIAGAFAGVVDAKSPWTYRHSDRVCLIVLGLASAFGAEEAELRDLRRAALLHDLGKLAISNRILDKPAALTTAEFRQVQRHPLITEQILRRLPGHEHIAEVAAAHHERLDGGGYPRGLSGADMTRNMRLLAIADVYEALTSERPYRRALRSDQALAIIRADVPHRLDREAFRLLEQLLADEPDADERFDAGRVQAALDHD